MKKIIKFIQGLVVLLTLFILTSIFWKADLRTADIKNNTQNNEEIAYAKKLLDIAIKKQGLDKISQFSTYQVTGTDEWKGIMGNIGNPWGWNNDKMAMRFTVGDFDSQVEALEGTKKGFVAGMQSWDYYEKINGEYQTDMEDDSGKMFAMAAFHYFFEFGNRLANAPFIRYAGKAQFNGQNIEKVFVSWGNECTNEYDQYLVWIGEKSGLIEASSFTTRDTPLPAPAFIYAALRFDDYRNVDGILIPFKQTAQMMDPKEDINDFIHQLVIEKFEWDAFPSSEIRPLKGIKPMGDDKPSN